MKFSIISCFTVLVAAGAEKSRNEGKVKEEGPAAYSYFEDLNIQQLQDGQVFFQFEFKQRLMRIEGTQQDGNWEHFPRDIGEIATQFGLFKLSLSLTQGRWMEDLWKVFVDDGNDGTSGTAGAEVFADFNGGEDVDERWKKLTHALSGLFCASLHFIDQTRTTIPRWTFGEGLNIRYGTLPRETTCTENLTPWIKLLPCKNMAGLATLLNAYRLYDSTYHSMRIDFTETCVSGNCYLELKQRLLLVLDPYRLLSSNVWSISSLFQRAMGQQCKISSGTSVSFTLPTDTPAHIETSVNYSSVQNTSLFEKFLFEQPIAPGSQPSQISCQQVLTIEFDFSVVLTSENVVPSGNTFFVERYLTGYGHEFGGLVIEFINHGNEAKEITYFDTLPWFVLLYMHTINIQINDEQMPLSAILHEFFYQPAIPRERPTVLEWKTIVPKKSIMKISMKFEKTMLRYTEYPPGAERGFDLGGAIVSIGNGKIYTPNILLPQPTPDFSMPYNVITLTCSVLALFFGTIYNPIMRSFKSEDAEPSGLRGVLMKIIRRVSGMFRTGNKE